MQSKYCKDDVKRCTVGPQKSVLYWHNQCFLLLIGNKQSSEAHFNSKRPLKVKPGLLCCCGPYVDFQLYQAWSSTLLWSWVMPPVRSQRLSRSQSLLGAQYPWVDAALSLPIFEGHLSDRQLWKFVSYFFRQKDRHALLVTLNSVLVSFSWGWFIADLAHVAWVGNEVRLSIAFSRSFVCSFIHSHNFYSFIHSLTHYTFWCLLWTCILLGS
jgi:hypothetical protein